MTLKKNAGIIRINGNSKVIENVFEEIKTMDCYEYGYFLKPKKEEEFNLLVKMNTKERGEIERIVSEKIIKIPGIQKVFCET